MAGKHFLCIEGKRCPSFLNDDKTGKNFGMSLERREVYNLFGNLFELLDEGRLYEREVSHPRTQQADSKDGVNS